MIDAAVVRKRGWMSEVGYAAPLGLSQYETLFRQNDIDAEVFEGG